jgi:hypothetical protein
LISLGTTASLEALIELASYGMLAVANALKHSEGIMMKFLMHASTAPGTSWQQQVQMGSQESTTFLREPASLSYRVTRMKFPRSVSTLKAIR